MLHRDHNNDSGQRRRQAPVFFVPVPPLFGVLSLAAGETVRVNCMVNEFTPGDAAGLNFRLMVWSVDAIG